MKKSGGSETSILSKISKNRSENDSSSRSGSTNASDDKDEISLAKGSQQAIAGNDPNNGGIRALGPHFPPPKASKETYSKKGKVKKDKGQDEINQMALVKSMRKTPNLKNERDEKKKILNEDVKFLKEMKKYDDEAEDDVDNDDDNDNDRNVKVGLDSNIAYDVKVCQAVKDTEDEINFIKVDKDTTKGNKKDAKENIIKKDAKSKNKNVGNNKKQKNVKGSGVKNGEEKQDGSGITWDWSTNLNFDSQIGERCYYNECPCGMPCCPTLKLVGHNLDSSLTYLSPKAKIKCKDLCRLGCKSQPSSRGILIKPGDGSYYNHCGQDTKASMACGWTPPYEFSCNRSQYPIPEFQNPKYGITRENSVYPKKDFIETNALNVARGIPKIPHPRITTHRLGDTMNWCKSGLARNHIFGKNFGKIPSYICGVKNSLAKEDYRMRCILENYGNVCKDSGHNDMNKMGLLDLQYTNNPLIRKSKLFIKPKIEYSSKTYNQPAHPCYMPPAPYNSK